MKSFTQYINEVLITFGGKAYPKFNQVVILAGGAGCYPKGTEFFTGSGWKNIEDYTQGDKVLQYDTSTNATSLVSDIDYVKLPVDQFYNINNRRVDFTTSSDHKHLTINEKTGKYESLSTIDILNQHNATSRGNKRKLVTSFSYSGGLGVGLSEDMIRLKVAVYADGHILPTEQPKVRVSLKKDRKIDRLRNLLVVNGIPYKEYIEDDFTRFEFKFDSKDKEFESYWYNCTYKELMVVCDEVIKWDGSITNRPDRKDLTSFHTTSVKSRDFVQFAFSATGKDVSIHVDERDGFKTCYGVYVNDACGVGISKNLRAKSTTNISKVDSEDGMMYCFSVPTGYFVVRQNGKIYVSGNSGKGFQLKNLIGIEGKVLDVDELKGLAIKSKIFAKKVKDETGYDLSSMDLRNPDNVGKVHDIINNVYNIPDKKTNLLATSILTAHKERKPNIVFDVTLKNIAKLEEISRNVTELGYDKKDIHIVWVINSVDVALEQNKNRSRIVSDAVFMTTHEGASLTMRKLLDMGSKLKSYMDGSIVFTFNQAKVDVVLDNSTTGGKYVKKANYIRVKEVGKPQKTIEQIDQEFIERIKAYTPDVKTWK